MVRIGISVEGPTEERFVKSVLIPHFLTKNIYLHPVSIGGNISVDRIKNELENLGYSFDYVTTLYDFYGFKRRKEGETKGALEQRILASIKSDLKNKVIPYIQMYEFEGLLFSKPEAIASILQTEELTDWAKNILSAFDNDPEKVNDSPQTAPSKRLEGHTSYRKTTHGPDIAKEIGLACIRERCAGFDTWLSRLESLSP